MIDEPTYSGCANQRYGPDAVTSRDLLRCPAAQMRSASPAHGNRHPRRRAWPRSAARARNTARRTRSRADTRSARNARDGRIDVSHGCLRREPPLDAPSTSSTSMSSRHIDRSRQRRRWWHWQIASRDTVDVLRRPRTVARRDASDRRGRRSACRPPPRCASARCRPTPSAPRRAPARRDRRSSSAATSDRGAVRRGDDLLRQRVFAGSPQHDRRQAVPLAQRARHRAEPRRAASACSATPRRD